ncbi:MAG: hypothetical protein KJ670_07375 [Alphaproteobacteria bacterium]|nr:hypothetical protein [Rhizobiaceae bacterium]MBU3962438.1 hypothetical protein [Alphaproteobacteria bacterium]MBU4048434.1 hypothetical protein [Alphaproteobacteria bacterium]MBU4088526.1 hypothetical protein [Alphaproteobacteria bacterium]MBU4159091.1 hypothetical protein [Alphaproteobacteria bacterium]
MAFQYFDDDKSIGPAELDLLQEVFLELCRNASVDPQGPEGMTLAQSLISLFKSGFRSKQELIYMSQEAPVSEPAGDEE